VALHFSTDEFDRRLRRARRALVDRGLDALLVFSQESRYYLTGFDTSGYVFFTCLVLTAGPQPLTLLTRRPDVEPARRTSIIPDIRVWYDAEDANPAEDLKAILAEKGLTRKTDQKEGRNRACHLRAHARELCEGAARPRWLV
jgi:Xaa-Pro aminopeptidase